MWVLAVIGALCVGANWWTRVRPNPIAENISKPTATIIIGLIGVLRASDATPRSAVVWGAIGFVCCLIGDVALLSVIDQFIVGLAFFLLGHIAFVVMFALLGLDRPALALVAAAWLALLLVIVGRRIVAGARTHDRALTVPVSAYLVVISSMALVAWATGNVAAILGATAFVVSDAVLGWRRFVAKFAFADLAVMVTYHAALLGIALSLR